MLDDCMIANTYCEDARCGSVRTLFRESPEARLTPQSQISHESMEFIHVQFYWMPATAASALHPSWVLGTVSKLTLR